MKTSNKIVSLQILRAISFLMIFCSHAGICKLASLGVSIFFVLSGFVMVYSQKSNNQEKISIKNSIIFSINKTKKLYRLHIISMIAYLMLIIIIELLNKTYINKISYFIKILFNISLLQSLVPNSNIYFSLNGVAWYLSSSLFIYMFYPMINKSFKNMKTNKAYFNIIYVFIIQFLLAMLLFFTKIEIPFSDNFSKWLTYICPFYRIGDFFVGCNLGYLFKNAKLDINKYKAISLELVSIIAIIINQLIYSNSNVIFGTESFRYTFISLPIASILVLIFAYNNGLITRLLSKSSVLLKIGDLSGNLFLIHLVVMKLMEVVLITVPTINLNIFVIAGIELIISYLISNVYNKILK